VPTCQAQSAAQHPWEPDAALVCRRRDRGPKVPARYGAGREVVGVQLCIKRVQLDWGSRESWSAVGSSTSKTRPRVSE
jgi:hypothetical protein